MQHHTNQESFRSSLDLAYAHFPKTQHDSDGLSKETIGDEESDQFLSEQETFEQPNLEEELSQARKYA